MNPYKIEFFDEAKKELRDNVAWYNNQRKGLGADFLAAFNVALNRVESNPSAQPKIAGHYRKIKLDRFPYLVVYSFKAPGTITIVAVCHTSRHPGYWENRAV